MTKPMSKDGQHTDILRARQHELADEGVAIIQVTVTDTETRVRYAHGPREKTARFPGHLPVGHEEMVERVLGHARSRQSEP